MIPIYKPYLPKESLKYAHDALDSTWLSSQGKYLQMVQNQLQDLLGVKYVLPLNNGTSAVHLVAKTLRLKTESKKIIVPNNVYVAAWNGFLFDGDWRLIPIETDLDTWNFDLGQLDKAIARDPDASVLVVHNVGNIINVPELQKKYPNTLFVEDNCEGFLGKYNGTYSGNLSLSSAISFFGNKNITSGEGGAFTTNDEESYLFAKCVHGQGQSDKRFIHKELGYNYRMTNIQAAILYGQLEHLDSILQMKEEVFSFYKERFKDRSDILIQNQALNTSHSNWMFGVRVPGSAGYEHAETFFKAKGIEIRPMFYSIYHHDHLMYNVNVGQVSCTNANILNKECFILPSYPELTKQELGYICDSLEEYVK